MKARYLVVWSTTNGNRSFGHCPATDDLRITELMRRYDGRTMDFESRYRWHWAILSVSVPTTTFAQEDATC